MLCRRFPLNNPEVFEKWKDFVEQSDTDKMKKQKPKKITKYSSICSKHFDPSDFVFTHSRKFLKKSAVPTFREREFKEQPLEENTIEYAEDPLCNSFCYFCRKFSQLIVVDQYYFDVIRKCLPSIVVLTPGFHRICSECTKLLNTFSAFIDMAMVSQNNLLGNEIQSIKRNIKVEPEFTNFEESSFHLQPAPQVMTSMAAQKKCEILEIVDIKPFHFENGLQHESVYEDEDEIQILSPKPMKVELMDPDDEGSNELELIRNYVFVSTVFLQDHNYTKSDSLENVEPRVKTENDEPFEMPQTAASVPCKQCSQCGKTFRNLKKYLIHKILNHKAQKYSKRNISLKRRFSKPSTLVEKTENLQAKHPADNFRREIIKKKEKIKSYICPTCSKEFKGSKNLYQHKISHRTASNYQCHLCNKKFKRSHGLKQHVKSIHEKEKNHKCPICNHKYLLKADMTKCRHSKLKNRL